MAFQNDYNRVAADFENWRRQQEAAQQQALEQQRIAEEQQRAAQVAAEQQRRQEEAMRQMQAAQQMQQAQSMPTQQIPTLAQTAQPTMPTQATPNYAEQARAIGLPWSPDDADYVQQINDYNARMNGLKQTAAERQATTDALRAQIEANPELLVQGRQNLANDTQLNTLADQLNAFYAKQNNVNQDDAQKAYTTAVLRTQIAQNPELFANAVAQFAPKSSGKKSSKKSEKKAVSGTPYEPSYVTEEFESPRINSRYDYEQWINSKKKIVDNAATTMPKQPKELSKEEKAVADDIERTISADSLGVRANPFVNSDTVPSKWLNPDYKLNKNEIKQAKQIIKEFNKDDARQGVRNGVVWGETPEARAEGERIQALQNKINPVAAFVSGMLGKIPSLISSAAQGIVSAGPSDFISDEQKEKAVNAISEARKKANQNQANMAKQNPVANVAGNFAGTALQYNAVNNALEGTALANTLVDKLGQIGANLALGEAADVALDTIPTEVENYQNGMRGADLAKDTALNLGANALFNLGGEFMKGAYNKAVNKPVTEAIENTAEQTVENAAKSAPTELPKLVEPETLAKQNAEGIDALANQQRQAAETIQDISKEIPEVPAQERSVFDTLIDARRNGTTNSREAVDAINAVEKRDKEILSAAEQYANDPEVKRLVDEVGKYQEKSWENLLDVENPVNAEVIKGHEQALNNLERYMSENAPNIPVQPVKNNYGDSIRESIKGLEMTDNVRSEVEGNLANIDGILSRIDNAKSADEVNAILDEAKATINNADATLQKNAATRNIGKYDFDESTKNLAEAINGKRIYITPEMKAELNFTNVSKLNDSLAFKSNGKIYKPKFTTNATTGTPIDTIFPELDAATGGAISNFMRNNDMDPDNTANMAKGISDYVSYLKANKDAVKVQKYSGGMFDDFSEAVQKAGKEKIDSFANTARNVSELSNTEPATKPLSNKLKVSETYNNTLKNSGVMSDEEIAENTLPQYFMYESKENKESVEEAIAARAKEGADYVSNRLKKEGFTQVDTDGMMLSWQDKIAEARALDQAGEDSSTAWNQANTIFRKIQQESTRSAQAMQALVKWSRNTPEGMLSEAEHIVNKELGRNNKNTLPTLLKKIGEKNRFEFSPEFQKRFLEEAYAAQEFSPNSRELKEAFGKLGKMVNDEIRRNTSLPKKTLQRATSLLMDNMLGNFRTLITRNAGGNLGLATVEQVATRPLAAGIDKLVSLKTGRRTQAGLSREALLDYLSGFKKGLVEEAQDIKKGVHTSRSGEVTIEDAIARNVDIFKTDSKNKLLQGLSTIGRAYDNAVAHGLSVGDRPFYEATYKQTLGDMKRLRSQGVLGKELQALSDKEFNTLAEGIAKYNALTAVYQNDSLMSDALLGFKKSIGQLSEGALGVDVLSQFSMPFVKTPANVIDRAIDYSPLGAARNTIRTIQEGGIGGENFNQNRFVNETARNILGTGMMVGAGVAAKNGYISGKYSKDKDEKQSQKNAGMQEYALNMPVNEDESYQTDISWVPILGSNAVAAAAAVNAANDPELSTADKIAAGVKGGGKAMFDQAMFQGLQRLFGQGESYNSDEGIVGNMINTIKQGATQAVPSLLRQATQVADPYQRDIANGDYDLNNIKNTIPGQRQTLQPRVNNEGEYVKENQGRNMGSKILEDMILPGKITHVKYTDLDKEAQRLQKITKNNKAYQPKPSRDDITTDTHTPTPEEYTQYQVDHNKAITETAKEVLKTDYYKNLDPEKQEATLEYLYKGIKDYAKNKYTGSEIKTNLGKIYKEKGAEAAAVYSEYYQKKSELKSKSTDNLLSIARGASKEDQKWLIPQAIAEGKSKGEQKRWDSVHGDVDKFWKSYGHEKEVERQNAYKKQVKEKNTASSMNMSVDQMKNLQEELAGYGAVDSSTTVEYYNRAKKEIPKLTTKEYADYLYKIGGSDRKISQKELISYGNNNNLSASTMNTYWKAFGNDWKQIPKLTNGKWTAKKR